MTGAQNVHVVLYHWHANKRSESADDAFFTPLADFFDFSIHAVDWHERLPDLSDIAPDGPLAFWITPPPFEQVRHSGRPVTWIPMWDTVRFKSAAYWAKIPKQVRVVAFSEPVAHRARAAGLTTLRLQYFRDPASLPPAEWSGERVAFYWNRNGLVSPAFLSRWCEALAIDRLLFKRGLDPLTDPRADFELPPHLGGTQVELVPPAERRSDFFRSIQAANILLAPRSHEGIGLTFLEGMARGCAVFANDGPTMNEYIESGRTGYLFLASAAPLRSFRDRASYRLRRMGIPLTLTRRPFTLSDSQAWDALGRMDLPALGAAARAAHEQGYAAWLRAIPEYAAFVAGA